jgi:hypothetical protein
MFGLELGRYGKYAAKLPRIPKRLIHCVSLAALVLIGVAADSIQFFYISDTDE